MGAATSTRTTKRTAWRPCPASPTIWRTSATTSRRIAGSRVASGTRSNAPGSCGTLPVEIQVRDRDDGQDARRRDHVPLVPARAGLSALGGADRSSRDPAQLRLARRFRRIADADEHRARHQEDHQAVVLEVDVVDDPEEG